MSSAILRIPGLLLGTGLLLGVAPVHGQERPAPDATARAGGVQSIRHPSSERRDPASGHGSSPISPGRAFLLSAAVPGAGQLALDQRRWPLYLAAEGAGWYGYLTFRADARELRAAYRTLAWDVPRQGFADERRDGDFEYYERMAKWPASGAFDADAATSGVQPETDPATFNGSVWALARELFAVDDGTDPASEPYRRALDYYRDRAVPEGFLWDWGEGADARARFAGLIRASDRDFERATTVAALLVGNHLLSAVDAYLSAGLRRRGLGAARLRVLPGRGAAPGPAWILRMEIERR